MSDSPKNVTKQKQTRANRLSRKRLPPGPAGINDSSDDFVSPRDSAKRKPAPSAIPRQDVKPPQAKKRAVDIKENDLKAANKDNESQPPIPLSGSYLPSSSVGKKDTKDLFPHLAMQCIIL